MLCLARKIGEQIVINDNITIKVLKLSGSRVVVGIEAPKEIRVIREELTDVDLTEST